MTPECTRGSESSSSGGAEQDPRPTRRGVLLGVGLACLGGVLAGCSTAAVPYDANEAGVPPNGPAPAGGEPARKKAKPRPAGTVLGAASEIPVGGGAIYTAAKVVVTQPASGRYRAFSAVCTHVGCVVNKVANGTIGCPCHGSEFTISNGAVVTGPAPAPLPAKQIKIVDGQVILL
jgi:Rieske Fe-S protein